MPALPGFCGGGYKIAGLFPDRTLNLYPENIEKGPRAGQPWLRMIPGLPQFARVGTGPIRSIWSNFISCFVVSGGQVWQLNADGTSALIGPIANAVTPALTVSNGFQLAFASNNQAFIAPGGGFGVVPIVDTTGAPVTAETIAFIDQYFIAALADSKTVIISNLSPNGATWDPGDEAVKEAYSDNIQRVWVDEPGGEYVYLFGQETMEVWVDTGALFPFQRVQGAVFPFGCDSPYSVAGVAGFRAWLWRGVVYGCQGFQPTRISDFGVEAAIKTYSQADQNSAEAFALIDGGHVLYGISFPISGATWFYDLSTQAWHERQYFANGVYSRYRPRVTAYAYGKQLVGDYATNQIYAMDPTVFTDANGTLIRRQRITPYIGDGLRNDRFNKLMVEMETGVGLNVPANVPGYDPQVILRYSNDRGQTWSNDVQRSAGRAGNTLRRVTYSPLGSSRVGFCCDLSMVDPVPTAFLNAFLDISPSTYPRN